MTRTMAPVALITDFGTTDWYVGALKGAILSISPESPIIDITHDIPPGDIKRAAYILFAAQKTFPEGTVFCVVVDPGVGSSRKSIAVRNGAYYYIGPDNGVLSWGWNNRAAPEVRIIENKDLLHADISATFHGRDIFGPAAAHCAGGTPFDMLGPVLQEYVPLSFPQPETVGSTIISPLLSIDRFGNLITAITGSFITLRENITFTTHINGKEFVVRKKKFFNEVEPGEPLCYFGSLGFLEIAVNQGNAARYFGISPEDSIEIDLP